MTNCEICSKYKAEYCDPNYYDTWGHIALGMSERQELSTVAPRVSVLSPIRERITWGFMTVVAVGATISTIAVAQGFLTGNRGVLEGYAGLAASLALVIAADFASHPRNNT